MELRPLGFGEIFDRAITLYVRNFLPFFAIVLVLIVPLGIVQYSLDSSQSAQSYAAIDTLMRVLQHPGAKSADASDALRIARRNRRARAGCVGVLSVVAVRARRRRGRRRPACTKSSGRVRRMLSGGAAALVVDYRDPAAAVRDRDRLVRRISCDYSSLAILVAARFRASVAATRNRRLRLRIFGDRAAES